MTATIIQSTTGSHPIRGAASWLITVEKVLLTRPRKIASPPPFAETPAARLRWHEPSASVPLVPRALTSSAQQQRKPETCGRDRSPRRAGIEDRPRVEAAVH